MPPKSHLNFFEYLEFLANTIKNPAFGHVYNFELALNEYILGDVLYWVQKRPACIFQHHLWGHSQTTSIAWVIYKLMVQEGDKGFLKIKKDFVDIFMCVGEGKEAEII